MSGILITIRGRKKQQHIPINMRETTHFIFPSAYTAMYT